MAEWVKIALKAGLVALIMVALWAVFANVQVPAIDYSQFSSALSTGLAVCFHWIPVTVVLFPLVIVLWGVQLAIYTFKYAMIAIKWLFKVNE